MSEEEFESAESGASASFPMQCSALRKNGFVLIKGNPCKIVDMSTSKTGKHGHAKVHLVGLDIFTNKKYEDICPSTHNMDVPNVKRKEYEVLDIGDDGFLVLMEDSGETREDLDIKKDQCNVTLEQAKEMFSTKSDEQSLMATVVSAMENNVVKDIKLKGNN